jgi:Putative transposase
LADFITIIAESNFQYRQGARTKHFFAWMLHLLWVRFTWKDYRQGSITKVMTLDADEFIRRFLLHALPDGFHRIRHYGFLGNGARADSIALCQRLLDGRNTGACEPADNRCKGDRPLRP